MFAYASWGEKESASLLLHITVRKGESVWPVLVFEYIRQTHMRYANDDFCCDEDDDGPLEFRGFLVM